jgi:hypothetical protein
MIVLELDGKLAAAEVDMGPPGRPPLVQLRVDTNNFPDRLLARIGTMTCGEPRYAAVIWSWEAGIGRDAGDGICVSRPMPDLR